MAENNSIANLSRQDLLTVLEGFIKQAKQINKIKDKYNSRYADIANKVLLTEYRKPKNLVIAYLLTPFYVLKGSKKYKKVKWDRQFPVGTLLEWFRQNAGWMVYQLGWICGLVGDIALIMLPFNIIDVIGGLFTLSLSSSTKDDLVTSLLFIPLGIIGYFMGRKKYMQHWFEKVIKKVTMIMKLMPQLIQTHKL